MPKTCSQEKSDPQAPSSPAIVERLRVVMCDDISESPFVSDCRMGDIPRRLHASSSELYGEVTLSPWMSASPRPDDTKTSSSRKESLSFYDMNPMVGF